MAEGLTIEVDGAVVRATLDRGDDNRLSMAICRELTELLLDPPPGAHILRIAAVGPAFCLGRDRAGDGPDELRDEVGALIELNRALSISKLVSVAVVHADAAGFGVGLASLADVTIAAASARFWFPEVEIDLAPTVVLTWLPGVVGYKQAFHLTATGERLTAARAGELGLVTRVASDEELVQVADEDIARLTGFAPRVHQEIKTFMNQADGLSSDQAYALSTEKLILGSMARRRE